MRRLVPLLIVVAVLVAGPALAGGFEFKPGFTSSDFDTLVDTVADAIILPNLGGGAAGGVTGFDVLVSAGGPKVDTGDGWWHRAVDGSAPGGILAGGRLVAHKGLPWGVDVGAQAGKLLGQVFWGAEVRYALLRGGALEPAVAVRVSYSVMDVSSLKVTVGEAQLVLSKGFTVVTPYVAGGWRRVEGQAVFGDTVRVRHDNRIERFTGAGGIRLAFPPLRVVGEVRQGATTGYYLGVGVGL
jgi:hypothetical protein